MTFAKYASDRRTHVQARRLGRLTPHPIQELRRGHAGALVISLSRHDARGRSARPPWSSFKVKAATTLSYFAGHALPALLLAIFSWAVAEFLAGCAAYAEAFYPPPAPQGSMPAEAPRGARPDLGAMTMQATSRPGEYGYRARPSARVAALPAERRGNSPDPHADWRIALTRLATACWSSLRRAGERRRAIAELQSLDDRSLRDIGISRPDIEYVIRYGTRRE
jgi:uncharacterized protein YjiS (DUF1127 family)